LSEYYHLTNLADYDGLFRAVSYLMYRHGRIDRLDSHSEHWLGLEARLRQDFNIFGQKPADLEFNRRKSGMKEIFRQAGVPVPAGEKVTSADQVRAFVASHGFPVVFKPDIGVGAQRVFRVDNEEQLKRVLDYLPQDYFVEEFVVGDLVSFDGMTDREGGESGPKRVAGRGFQNGVITPTSQRAFHAQLDPTPSPAASGAPQPAHPRTPG